MAHLGCLVMPSDLASAALAASPPGFGWIEGAKLGQEWVFVALALVPEGGEQVRTDAFARLKDHRAVHYGAMKQRLMPWVTAHRGLALALRLDTIKNLDDLAQWLHDVPVHELVRDQFFLCCIEPGLDESTASFFVVIPGDNGAKDTVFAMDVEPVPAAPDPFARVRHLAPLAQLRGKRAAVIGLGSGGGFAALELAAAGVGTLHLVDRDRLRAPNLFRHICGAADLGRTKVAAVADLIRAHDLPGEVVPHADDILISTDRLRAIVAEVDIVLGATDTVTSRRLLNYLCVRAGTPVIFAGTFDNARIGEIIRVLPGRTACYECTRRHLRDWGSLGSEPEAEEDAIPYGPQVSEATATGGGTRTDVFMVAALQAKTAMTMLLADDPTTSNILPHDYVAWGAVPNRHFPEPFRFDYPFAAKYVTMPRWSDCPVCGLPPIDLREIEIEKVYAEIFATQPEAEDRPS